MISATHLGDYDHSDRAILIVGIALLITLVIYTIERLRK
jgi:hypothetical protein